MEDFSDPRMCLLARNWNLVVSDPHHFQTIQFLGARVSGKIPGEDLELGEFLSKPNHADAWLLYFGHTAMRGMAHFVSARICETWDRVYVISVASEQLVLAVQNRSPLADRMEHVREGLIAFFTNEYGLDGLVQWNDIDDCTITR